MVGLESASPLYLMDEDSRRERFDAETAALESSGTGWGLMEPGALTLGPGACVGAGGPQRYEVRELLGRGLTGEVHLAFDKRVGRDVAVKVLSDTGRSRSELRASFLREARLQGILDHPGIVPVHDVDRDAEGRDFFAMKHVIGTTLEEVVRRVREGDANFSAKFPLRRLLSAYLQMCLTVEYAHRHGVVHRDLKPSNLMLGDYGEVYVLDWGLAKTGGTEGLVDSLSASGTPLETLSNATYLLGTPGYMAPEQAANPNEAGAQADVYSLGVVLFTVLTGERLHRGDNAFEILESTRLGTDARPTVRAPDRGLPPEYDAVCARATAVDPAERYRSVRELHDAVSRVLDGDRDMRLRVKLAAGHLAEAEHALASAEAAGLSPSDASRIALRHAARSLALHPRSKEAAVLVSQLMLTPPEEAPPEMKDETLRLESAVHERTDRDGQLFLIGMLPLIVSLFAWVGVRSWGGLAIMALPLVVAPLIVTLVRTVRLRILASAVCVSFGVAMSSRIAGSLWFPSLCALFYVGIISWNHSLGNWRIPASGIVLMASMVPWVLELAGITSSQYVFQDGGLIILSDLVSFPPGRTEVALAFGQSVAILLMVAAFFRFSRHDVETRRRLQLMAWHLRGLAPSAEDEAEITASTAPVRLSPALAPNTTPPSGLAATAASQSRDAADTEPTHARRVR